MNAARLLVAVMVLLSTASVASAYRKKTKQADGNTHNDSLSYSHRRRTSSAQSSYYSEPRRRDTDYRRRQAATPSPATPSPPTPTSWSSGTKTLWLSGTSTYDYSSSIFVRPNYLKHERCSGDSVGSCEECSTTPDDTKNCMNTGNDGQLMTMNLMVTDPNPTWKVYRTVFVVHCSKELATSTLAIEIEADSSYIGSWKVFVNGAPQAQSSSGTYSIPLAAATTGQKGTEVQLEFLASQHGAASTYTAGTVKMTVTGITDQSVNCEDNQVCMWKLADTADARKLRGGNEFQLQCLQEPTSPHLPDFLRNVCSEWKSCVTASGWAGRLKTLLAAGLTGHSSAAGVALLETSSRACADTDGCVDPRTTDAEGWGCNCLEDWQVKCASIGHRDSSDCVAASFCLSEYVCDCWKEISCGAQEIQNLMGLLNPSALLERQSATRSESSQTSRAISHGALDAGIEDTLDKATGSKACI